MTEISPKFITNEQVPFDSRDASTLHTIISIIRFKLGWDDDIEVILGDPKEFEGTASLQELKDMGMMGIYIKKLNK